MPLTSKLSSFWHNLRHKRRRERELHDEIGAYVDLLTEDKIAAGLSPAEARRAALVEVGGVEQAKEAVRDVRAGMLLETVAHDVKYGARSLIRAPGFTLAAVVALGLGIGANTAMFSVIDAVLLRPLRYRDPGALVVLLHNGYNPVSPANFLDWRRQGRSFVAMGAAQYWTPNLSGTNRPEKVWALRLTGDVLPLLGVQPLLGRYFEPPDTLGHDPNQIVIAYGLWRRVFASDPGIIGRPLMLDGSTYTVVGVMPPSFRFAPFWATRAEVWAPLSLADNASDRGGSSLRVFARLKPGVTLRQAQAEIATITARLEQEYPGTNRNVTVQSLTEKVVGGVRRALVVILVAVAFVLLIACANVAHMLLARSAARQREMAVRTAIGASRGRIVRQLLTESLLLALIGGAAGLLIAIVGVRALVALSPGDIPRIDTASVDGRVVGVTVLVSLLTGVFFGLAPAWRNPANAGDALREEGRGSTEGRERGRLRSVLVASEFALALVLLVGAGLMMRTFVAERALDPGFDPHHVLSMVVSVTGTPEGAPAQRAPFFQSVLERVRALPGVASAGAINHLPLAGDEWGWPFSVEGQPTPRPGERPVATYRVVLPGYFRTMGLRLLAGRDVTPADDRTAPGVVIVSDGLARRYLPGESPLGKRIAFASPDGKPVWLTIVGIAANAKQSHWTNESDPEAYLPYLQNTNYLEAAGSWVEYLTLVVRGSGDPAALAPAVRNAVWSADKTVTISEVQTMDHVVSQAMAEPRFYVLLLGAFAGVALTLAAVGIYGVMSYGVARRRHEIGIRVALGAGRGGVIGMVVRQGMAVAAVGAGVGALAAFGLTRLMAGMLYGVTATDATTFVAVPLVLCGVALAACTVPAWRATRINPLTALRQD
jgi:predicted permease